VKSPRVGGKALGAVSESIAQSETFRAALRVAARVAKAADGAYSKAALPG
jgi:hypothetical protein